MNAKTAPRTIMHVISVAPAEKVVAMVLTIYPETDALNAVGHVIIAPWRADRSGVDPERERGQTLLNSTDTLQAGWSSPAGHLWITSARGNVWTTAPVSWPPQRVRGVRIHEQDRNYDWKATTLPNREGSNHPPILNCIWGTTDSDIHVGDFGGAIYHWNGHEWRQLPTGVRTGINQIHGIPSGDVFAVGDRGVVLHLEGERWHRIPYPSDAGASDALTGVRVVARDDVFVCGRGGRVLHGGAQGLHVISETTYALYALAYFKERVIVGAGNDGVFTLDGNQFTPLKPNLSIVGFFESPAALFAVEAAQEPRPRLIEYNPDREHPWLIFPF